MSVGLKVIIAAILLAGAGVVVDAGLQLRRDVWDYTTEVRFTSDITNAWLWGRAANRYEGALFDLYDDVAKGGQFQHRSELDYTPLRLAVATTWQKWTTDNFPGISGWQNDYEMTRPMLYANSAAELSSSILVFLIILIWQLRMPATDRKRSLFIPIVAFVVAEAIAAALYSSTKIAPNTSLLEGRVIQWWLLPFCLGLISLGSLLRGVAPALLGALLLWFNPAVIWDAHAWPQWDVWLMPFFLLAVLLATLDWWFPVGVCIVVGACLKGQTLLGAPILLLWPIFSLRFDAVLKLLAGAVLGISAIVLPWMNVPKIGIISLAMILSAMALLTPFVLRARLGLRWMIALGIVAIALAWPWNSDASIAVRLLPMSILAFVAMARFAPPKMIPHLYALAVGLTVLSLIPVYHASTGWWDIGFARASEQYHHMLSGRGSFNVPALLRGLYRWPNSVDDELTFQFASGPITMKFRTGMIIIYGTLLVLMGIGAAINQRRQDVRFLAAMVAPWVFAYLLMTQMHGRYLIWGAAMSALLAGVGWGLALLGIVLSCISWFGMSYNQYAGYNGATWDPVHFRMLQYLVPNLGWMLLLASAILLYYAIVPRSRSTLT